MRRWSHVCLAALSVALVTVIVGTQSPTVSGQSDRESAKRMRFTHDANLDSESHGNGRGNATEAPAAFDNLTNGLDVQATFDANRVAFEDVEGKADGLGPTYNAQSCRECHQNIVTGGASQVTVQRAGHLLNGQFFDSQGGSLIHSRATYAEIVELVTADDPIRALRISPSTLGDGFIEAIANDMLLRIRDGEPAAMRGIAVIVPVLEAHGAARIGRFGWKSQHASLESFAADAYLNEMGITTPLLPIENTSSGRDVTAYDARPDPDDDGDDVEAFANFMRSTKAPPRGPITAQVSAGERVFTQVGCATCHVASITTAPAGTTVNGGVFVVPEALGNKIIHPYSDFLLHDVGTGDGIPIQPTDEYAPTASRMRTAPLWALRTRNRLMHDGLSLTREEAIVRHGGQAAGVTAQYKTLSDGDRAALLTFLNSL
jgi:CxxC motif-containing protein (DUF1111 family)